MSDFETNVQELTTTPPPSPMVKQQATNCSTQTIYDRGHVRTPDKNTTNKSKSRRKPQSYQSLMASITKKTKTDEEIRAEHQKKIKQELGGGQFKKLERIE